MKNFKIVIILCKTQWHIGPASGSTVLKCICLLSINEDFLTSGRVRHHQWITRRQTALSLFFFYFCRLKHLARPLYFSRLLPIVPM